MLVPLWPTYPHPVVAAQQFQSPNPTDIADGPADNKTQGCRSDHYFSQDLNQGGENDPPRSKVSNRLALTDWCTDLWFSEFGQILPQMAYHFWSAAGYIM